MIDNLVIGATHALLLLTAWRLINRPELDDENTPAPGKERRKPGWGRKRA